MNIKKILLLLIMLFIVSGCDNKVDDMKDINIYTSIYPTKYLLEYLYSDYSTIKSIYPIGVIGKDISNYKISETKLKEYSNGDLFVFNSLDKDKDYAAKMINYNKKLKIIDCAQGMNDFDYSIEELWVNPYNYLMMAENVKNGLIEYISNPYLANEVENKFDSLKYDISKLDSDLTTIVNDSTDKIIVTDNNLFKFLEKYGLKVISLEENNDLSINTINEVKKLIEDKEIKYIYSNNKESNSTVNKLIEDYNLELISLNTMYSIDGGINNTNDNYLTVMTNNINLLKKELYN